MKTNVLQSFYANNVRVDMGKGQSRGKHLMDGINFDSSIQSDL